MKLKEISEMIVRKKVVRRGKRYVKFTTDKEGYKIVNNNGSRREVKMSYIEIRKRAKAGKRAARKRKGKKGQMDAMRKRSMAMRL